MKKSTHLLPTIILEDIKHISTRVKKALKMLEGKTVLIAGAAGFLPSYLVHVMAYINTQLLEHPVRIICLDNFSTGIAQRLKPWEGKDNIKFITKDITKLVNMGEHIDYIIHAASIASPIWYRKFPLQTIDVNVNGTRRLLDLAHKQNISSFIYLSSSEVYGDPIKKFIPTSEDYLGNVSAIGPRACYDESKRLAETLCMVYYRQFGVPIKIIRPFNVYGPGLRLDDGRIVPDLIKDALNNRPITLFSNGKTTRSFCYITDAVVAILMLMISDIEGEAFNVGNNEEVSILKLAKVVKKVSGNTNKIQFKVSSDKAYLTDNPQRRVPDLRKIKQSISWSPEISLEIGLRRTLKFYQEGEAN